MYTDDTIMLTGKYKFIRLKNIPSEYLIKLYENNSITDRDLINYINLNMDKLLEKNSKKVIIEPLPCTKLIFASKQIANDYLNEIYNKEQSYKKPIRSYECEKCGFWHITSMPIEIYNKLSETK
jgi:hypothetical protein